MVVFLNGRFVEEEKAVVSVFDHGFLYADGVYETLRTYGGVVWQMDEHLWRLEHSAGLVGVTLPWSLRKIGIWILETIVRNGFPESRIRVTVTRGANGFDFGSSKKPTICIQVQKLIPELPDVYQRGVDVVSFSAVRTLPEAKTLSLLPMVLAQRFMRRKGAYEALFVDNGCVREGTVTNVFAVIAGVLVTPGKGMLAGTTRDFLLKLARRQGMKARVRDLKLAELFKADEVFVTNAPRGIVPVRKVDGEKIGKDCPGPVIVALSQAFGEEIATFVEESGGV